MCVRVSFCAILYAFGRKYPAAAAKQFNVEGTYTLPHPIYDQKQIETVDVTHKVPETVSNMIVIDLS